MTNYYESVNNVVAGTARALLDNESIYIPGGIHVGTTGTGAGVTGNISAHVTVFGELLSVGGVAFKATHVQTNLLVGLGGSVSGDPLNGIGVWLQGGTAQIMNDGSITGGRAILIDGTGGNHIANTGHISATEESAIDIDGGGNAISNSGTIYCANSVTIYINGGDGFDTNRIENSGTIGTGSDTFVAISTSSALDDTTVTNSGHIDGGVYLGQGDDVYDGTLGTIRGIIIGNVGNDTLMSSAGNDTFRGDGGADFMEGGGGRNVYFYSNEVDSTSTFHDTIADFNFGKDKLDLNIEVTAVDANVNGGRLRSDHFDTDLAQRLDATHLLVDHAVLLAPGRGDLKGHLFLVVDANGIAGYQAGADYVVDVSDAANLAKFSTHNFLFHDF